MKCKFCKKTFNDNEHRYCSNCGKEIVLEKKKLWPYFFVIGVTFINLILIILAITTLFNDNLNYEIEDIRDSKVIEEVKKLGCDMTDMTEVNNNANVLSFYVTDETCPYLIHYTKFSSSSLQLNYYNKLIEKANNTINGYYSYSNINIGNYKEYEISSNTQYIVTMYSGKNTFYMESDIKNKEVLNNLKKEFGYTFTFNLSFLKYIIPFIIIMTFMSIISWWKLNKKIGRKEWISLIPIYNILCLCEDVMGKKSYALLLFIPGINIVTILILFFNIANVFGKNSLYQILTIFFPYIMIPLIAFDESKYTQPQKINN